MNVISIKKSWEDILSITVLMEESASLKDWESVSNNAEKRHTMIKDHFKKFAVGPQTASFYSQHLSLFLQKEEQLKTLTNNARQKILRQNLTLISNKKAAGAYQVSYKL